MGKVFNIQRFSVDDGPGVRTTVFLKGCPLNCVWCHNPESKRVESQLFFDAPKCVNCGKCAIVCSQGCHDFSSGEHIFNREKCVLCGKCISVCPLGLFEIVGQEMTSDEVIAEVLKDKVFYDNSNGGITLSGGEPTMQFHFALEILEKAKANGIHTALETCGYCEKERLIKLAQKVDLFLYDYKETNPQKHEEFTGKNNKKILSNLETLSTIGSKVILRCPIIPGLNDRDEHFKGICAVANEYDCITEINILPYHPLGIDKERKLGKSETLQVVTPMKKEVLRWVKQIKKSTKKPVKDL